MKKVLLLALPILVMASCGNREAEKAAEDSARMVDSIAKIEEARQKAEQARIDSIRQDSILNSQIEEQYKNAITLNPGKKSVRQLDEHTDKIVDWPLELVNNTDIALSSNDYEITYLEEYEDMTPEGDLEMFKKNRKLKGPDLSPKGSGEAKIHDSSTEDIRNPKVKLKISKEEFAKRYREAKASR